MITFCSNGPLAAQLLISSIISHFFGDGDASARCDANAWGRFEIDADEGLHGGGFRLTVWRHGCAQADLKLPYEPSLCKATLIAARYGFTCLNGSQCIDFIGGLRPLGSGLALLDADVVEGIVHRSFNDIFYTADPDALFQIACESVRRDVGFAVALGFDLARLGYGLGGRFVDSVLGVETPFFEKLGGVIVVKAKSVTH